jgi:hypothetical protein
LVKKIYQVFVGVCELAVRAAAREEPTKVVFAELQSSIYFSEIALEAAAPTNRFAHALKLEKISHDREFFKVQ